MKIKDKILGKEVIDEKGVIVGKIKDLELDFNSNKIDTIEIEDLGLSSKLGIGESKVVPFHLVEQIGDKVRQGNN